jgi:hypothetical protein
MTASLAVHATHGDARLSRFDPLQRVIYFDDFDRGHNGWTTLVGNYEDSLETMTRSYARHMQPMLSQVTHWDSGTHGSFDGTYALKIATRAVPGERNTAIKRITFRKASRLRVETYFAFKPEANELKLSVLDVRSVGLLFDLQDGRERVMPHLRYLNALDGQRMDRWQFKQRSLPFRAVGGRNETVTHDHLSPQDWEDIPGAGQKLCYNEIPTKINWHYLRFDFDLERMRWLGFQCNDQVFDCAGVESIRMPAMPNLSCMLNLVFFCESDTRKRAFLYLDSVLLSGEF